MLALDLHERVNEDALTRLLSSALLSLYTDPRQAQTCMMRAACLVQEEAGLAHSVADAGGATHGGLAPWQARRLRLYINAHLSERIPAAALASLVDLSTSHFFRAFRESFSETPMTYVAIQRIQRAQELMVCTHHSLAEIARACGLCDQAHFTRLFRRVTGLSPRAWRRQFLGAPEEMSV